MRKGPSGMALTAKIRAQFEQLHGVSLDAASQMLTEGGSAPCLGDRAPVRALPLIGRGHPLLDTSVDPESRHRENQEIIRGW